jgi:hypothetical protein
MTISLTDPGYDPDGKSAARGSENRRDWVGETGASGNCALTPSRAEVHVEVLTMCDSNWENPFSAAALVWPWRRRRSPDRDVCRASSGNRPALPVGEGAAGHRTRIDTVSCILRPPDCRPETSATCPHHGPGAIIVRGHRREVGGRQQNFSALRACLDCDGQNADSRELETASSC